ncbi:MAG: ABC transporter permease [Candidatus Accumulibacter sp.]|nr:ABC transporter permease [Accumulibacter sp.]
MWQFFLSSWRSGLRNQVFLAVFAFAVALIGVAFLSASFSPRQPRTVALDIGLSGLRISLILFAITLVQDLVGQEIERRVVVLSLSYPTSRAAYLVGRYFGVLALTGVAALILGLLLWIAVLMSGLHYEQQFRVVLGAAYWVTVFGIWLDVAVVSAFTLWIATLSTVAMLPLALGAVFAIVGRALGAVFDYVANGADGQVDIAARYGPALDVIRWVLPDLSRLDWRGWPMYGLLPDPWVMGLALLMAVAYSALMIGLAIHSFSRREFS